MSKILSRLGLPILFLLFFMQSAFAYEENLESSKDEAKPVDMKQLMENKMKDEYSKYLSEDHVAVLRLSGAVFDHGEGFISFNNFRTQVDQAFNMPNVKSVMLMINSGGGSPAQADLLVSYIRHLSKEKNIPVYSFVEDSATSMGYYLALAGEEIYALPYSNIGSIGVIRSGFGHVDRIKKEGKERRVFTSGKYKRYLDPYLPLSDEDVAMVNQMLGTKHNYFTNFVKERREGKLDLNNKDLFSGKIWAGRKSTELGLIDGVQTIHDFMSKKFPNATPIYVMGKQTNFADTSSNLFENTNVGKIRDRIKKFVNALPEGSM